MRIISMIGRGLLIAIVTASVSLWITVMTLQATVLNREVVLGWLDKSSAYDHVVSSVISLQSADKSQSLDAASLQNAVTETLTPSYIKQVAETGLNAVYDWLEGKSDTIVFSIPVTEKRTELQKQLQDELIPQLKALPACTSSFSGLSSQDIKCLPPGSDAEEAATNAAKQAIDGSDFLTEPITQEAINQTGILSINWLPTLVQSIGLVSIGLPILAIVCGLGYVLMSERKLMGVRTLAGHLFFGTILGTLIGLGLWYFGGTIQLDQAAAAEQVALLSNVVQPIIYQVFPAIGLSLLTFAGSIALVSAITWITLLIVGKKFGEQHALNEAREATEHAKEEPEASPEPTQTAQGSDQAKQPTPPEPKPPTRTIGHM